MSGLGKRIMKHSAVLAAVCLFAGSASAADLNWQTDVHVALKQARATSKPMLIQFTASWCHFCVKMKQTTYADASVQRQVTSQFIPVMLDADENAELVSKLGIKGLPATVMVAPDLRILKKLNGYQRPGKLQSEMKEALVIASPTKVASVGYARAKKQPVARASDRKPTARPNPLPSIHPDPRSSQRQKPQAEKARAEPLGFDGVSLVALRNQRKLVKGDPGISMVYRSTTLRFTSEKELREFKSNPEKFWPHRDGVCLVSSTSEEAVAGLPQFGVMYRDRIWFFSSLANMHKFVEAPQRYLKK